MKRLLLLILGILFISNLKAQQDPRFTQFMFNKLVTNSGYAGSKGLISTNLIYRHEWIGFDGEPVTQNFSIDAPIEKLHGGVGLSVVNDALGFENTTGGLLHYSYRTNAGSGVIGIGIQAGFFMKGMNVTDMKPSSSEFDAAIPTASQSGWLPDLGLGVYYNTKKLYFGLSSSHIIESKMKYSGSDGAGNTYSGKLQFKRHYYISTGYEYDLGAKLALMPSVLIKSDGTMTQLDVNTNLAYKIKTRKAWVGLSYSSGDLIRSQAFLALLLGMDITQNLHFGYAYDVTPTAINLFGNRLFNTSIQTHEIMLGYDFSISPPAKPIHIIRTPRFL
ncbi:MAG: type IX secretion system membrane protein PorP/SprF [Bacteroidia bacterium]|nr:type IX secretion system membrane protein PorP/SprF [Bacteroidia bacterium]